MKLLIQNGTVVNAKTSEKTDVLVEDGKMKVLDSINI